MVIHVVTRTLSPVAIWGLAMCREETGFRLVFSVRLKLIKDSPVEEWI